MEQKFRKRPVGALLLLLDRPNCQCETECSKMILSMGSHSGGVPRQTMRSSDNAGASASKADIVNAEVTDLTRRIVLMERMIADFDRMAADLDQGIRIEEDRVKIRDPA